MRKVSIKKLRREENLKRRIACFLTKHAPDITVYMVIIEKHHALLYAKYHCEPKTIERMVSDYFKITIFLRKEVELLNE